MTDNLKRTLLRKILLKEKEVGLCGECERCEPVWLQHTLTVYGKRPTLGTCPLVTDRKVLLSEKGCSEWIKRSSHDVTQDNH